ncbi:MAG TPA: ribosome silencing factor [bacterium]|nr:ribosome silencing factor [bacterium]HQN73869.1 ribosome silencing factor [bacterium]HQO92427.1 ribosome silencing factor [bacterium]
MTKNEMSKLKKVISTLSDKKGINITVFDVDRQSGYTDYMVFVTGTSIQHNNTMSEALMRELKTAGFNKPLVEGSSSAKWILLDAGDVVVNIMLDELRDYYSLEDIWVDSSKVDISSYLS